MLAFSPKYDVSCCEMMRWAQRLRKPQAHLRQTQLVCAMSLA
jgi:hypothetical protein